MNRGGREEGERRERGGGGNRGGREEGEVTQGLASYGPTLCKEFETIQYSLNF